MSRLQVTEDYKPGRYVCMHATYTSNYCSIWAHVPAAFTVSLQKTSPKSGTAVHISLEITASPFLTFSQGYNHRQGHSVSKYTKPPRQLSHLHFYNILKKHKYEPQEQPSKFFTTLLSHSCKSIIKYTLRHNVTHMPGALGFRL